MSDEIDFLEVASQLQKPSGDLGYKVAAAMNRSNRNLNSAAITALNLQENERVLEIGMGNGLFVEELLSSTTGIHYTGCDHSELMVSEAERINLEFIRNEQVKFVQANTSNLPFPTSSFHKIFCVNLIYFWNNPSYELKKIKRVLIDKGIFTIAIKSKQCMKRLPFSTYGFTLYDAKDVISLLENNGFTIKNVVETKEIQTFGKQEIEFENIIITSSK